MARGKLGVGCYRASGDILDAIKLVNADLVLLCDTALEMSGEIRAWKPDALIIGRIYKSSQPLGESLEEAFQLGYEFGSDTPMYSAVGVWTSYCEVCPSNPVEHQKLNKFELGFSAALHRRGKKSCILNFAVGWPEASDLIAYYGECLDAADYLGLHAYGHKDRQLMNDPEATYYALRYRRLHDALLEVGLGCPPIILTESGTYLGWRGEFSEEQIAADFEWLGNEMLKDDYVAGTTAWIVGTANELEFKLWEMLGTSLPARFGQWNNLQQGGQAMDQVELWLKDLWERQGVNVNPMSGFFQYALKQARESNRIMVPCVSPDGNYENWSYLGYVLAYTIPPMWCKVNEWVIKEGFPPLS